MITDIEKIEYGIDHPLIKFKKPGELLELPLTDELFTKYNPMFITDSLRFKRFSCFKKKNRTVKITIKITRV